MQLYNCTVRLSGSMLNEVAKKDVTAAEIQVLRAVHSSGDAGVEVVKDIVPVKHVDRTDAEERERLEDIYGAGLVAHDHIKSLNTLLGHPTTPLPQSVPGVDNLPAPKSGRRAKVEKRVEPDPAEDAGPIMDEEYS